MVLENNDKNNKISWKLYKKEAPSQKIKKLKLRMTIEGSLKLISKKNENNKIQQLHKKPDKNVTNESFQSSSPKVCLEGAQVFSEFPLSTCIHKRN